MWARNEENIVKIPSGRSGGRRVAHSSTSPRRTHLNFRVPDPSRLCSVRRVGVQAHFATTVPPNSYLACWSDAAEALRPRRKNLYQTCPSQLVQVWRDFGQSAPILSGRATVFAAASRYT